jgi:hypothetical protein
VNQGALDHLAARGAPASAFDGIAFFEGESYPKIFEVCQFDSVKTLFKRANA